MNIALNERVVGKLREQPRFAGKVFAPSFLLITQQIDNSKSQYKFDIKKNGNENVIERKLDRNDTFVVTGLEYYIIAVVSGKFGLAHPMTYPNQTVFPAVTADPTFVPTDLEIFWNATLSLKIASTVHAEGMNLRDAYIAHTTQKSGATNYSERIPGDGVIPLAPQWILEGDKNIEITVDVPVFEGAKVANTNANTVNYLVVKPVGYLVKETNRV